LAIGKSYAHFSLKEKRVFRAVVEFGVSYNLVCLDLQKQGTNHLLKAEEAQLSIVFISIFVHYFFIAAFSDLDYRFSILFSFNAS
jgi:hypothetical protein